MTSTLCAENNPSEGSRHTGGSMVARTVARAWRRWHTGGGLSGRDGTLAGKSGRGNRVARPSEVSVRVPPAARLPWRGG